ncbi:hypothetical protein GF420_08760 [candidate division GN15 bacterium]|nr:hypothetical protein [candidate division GN15 bacterium]
MMFVNYRTLSTTFLLVVTLTLTATAAGVLPVGQPEYRAIYDRLERLETLSADRVDWQLGPYPLDDDRFSFGPFTQFRNAAEQRVHMFGFAGGDVRASKGNSGEAFGSFRGGLVGRPIDRVFVYGSFTIDEELAEDPEYHGKVWRGFAGDVQDAFVRIDGGSFAATIGRFGSFWGIRNSLVLAGDSRLDGFGYRFRWGRLTISYRLARLDGLSPQHDGVEEFENRYFAGHRLDWHISDRFRIGGFETVIFGGPGRQIELFYLNPLIFFHGTQLNEGADDNTLIGFDFTARPMLGLKLYGQLLIDDFQIDKRSQGDQETDQFGATFGLYAVDFPPQCDVRLEYTRVTNWTFNQVLERNRYSINGDPLGAARGNDYDEFRLSLIRWLDDDLSVRLNGGWLRQGEGRVDAEWTAPWLATDGDYSEPFPTGVVERTVTGSLGLNGFVGDYLFVDVTGGVEFVHNRNHVAGDEATRPFAQVTVSAFLSTLVDLE